MRRIVSIAAADIQDRLYRVRRLIRCPGSDGTRIEKRMAKRASKLEEPAVTPDEAEATTIVAEEPDAAVEATADLAPEEAEPVLAETAPAEPIEPEPDPRAPLDDPLMPGSVSMNAAGTHAAFIQHDASGHPER